MAIELAECVVGLPVTAVDSIGYCSKTGREVIVKCIWNTNTAKKHSALLSQMMIIR